MSKSIESRSQTLARVSGFWLGYLTILVMTSSLKNWVAPAWAPLTWGLGSVLGLLGLTWLLLPGTRRDLVTAGLRVRHASWLRLLAGLLLGATNLALMMWAISTLATPLSIAPSSPASGATIALAVAGILALATMEELGFRGYTLRELTSAFGPLRAQIVVAMAFGLTHLAYGWPWQTVLVGVIPAALLFGAAAHVSGGLALPIGIHAGINLARWAIGENETPGFWVVTAADPAQTPAEGLSALLGVAVTLILTASLWIWHARRKLADTVR